MPNFEVMIVRLLFCFTVVLFGSAVMVEAQQPPVFKNHGKQTWVDSVFNSLTPTERLAQLFMVAAYSNRDSAHIRSLQKLVEEHKIGGLIFFQGGPVRQATMCNHLQSKADLPMLIAMDAEWGVGMRLDSTIDYPRQMSLGAIQDDRLIYDFGVEVARQMKRMGMHVNFAPVIDVNSNATNPVIGTRSFGENKLDVAKKGIAYMKGMQDNHVLACAKHFPGHGDTDSDSHLTLPIIKHDLKRLNELELFPFRGLIKEGIGSMMVAHLYIPALDKTPNLASTLSPNVVDGLLRDSLGYDGLIFTDALNMKGVSKYWKPGEVDLKAFMAGNDVMLFAEDVPTAIKKITEAINAGKITQAEVDRRCRKMLETKAWVGLDDYQPIETENLWEDLNNGSAVSTNDRLAAGSITTLINENSVLPLSIDPELSYASVAVNQCEGNEFQKSLDRYGDFSHFWLTKKSDASMYAKVRNELIKHDVIVINIATTNSRRSKNYGITQSILDLVAAMPKEKTVIVSLFGNPYMLSRVPGFDEADALLFGYEQTAASDRIMAEVIMGGRGSSGRLPVTANRIYRVGDGENTVKNKIGMATPNEVGLDSKILSGIDSITLDAIEAKATPGAQVMVAKDGMVVYEKNFGHQTYAGSKPITSRSIYDLASITKIASTLMAFMKLVDEGKVSVDDKLVKHLPRLKFTNKENITFRQLLAHQARLKAWIPFYTKTLKDGSPDTNLYKTKPDELHSLRVAQNLYMLDSYRDSVNARIDDSSLRSKAKYKYSDLGYYYLKQVVEKYIDKPIDEYVTETFFKPMGLRTMRFHPREHFELTQIVPTEYDMTFRKQLIQGDVHDPGAAMMGGVGGHAGLFSNAQDLIALMQMYLNMGEYGGRRYISEATMKEFTRCQFCANDNRRGLGFDKPVPDGEGGPTCDCVSLLSFGHTGFTGTMAWADPEKGTVYVFLSNRVYPDAENRKLLSMDVRTRIQEVIYDAIED